MRRGIILTPTGAQKKRKFTGSQAQKHTPRRYLIQIFPTPMLPLLSSSCQPPIGNPSHLRKQSKRQEPGSQPASTSTPANPLSITASANSSLTNPFLYTHSLVASVASAPPPPAPPNPIDLRRLQIPGGRRQRAPGGGPPSGARVFALSPIRYRLCAIRAAFLSVAPARPLLALGSAAGKMTASVLFGISSCCSGRKASVFT